MWKTIFNSTKKNPSSSVSDIQKINSYLFVRWLSNHPKGVRIGNFINTYPKIPIEQQYTLVNKSLSSQNVYIPFKKEEKKDTELYEAFIQFYTISADAVPQYLEFTSEEQREQIISLYNTRKKYNV